MAKGAFSLKDAGGSFLSMPPEVEKLLSAATTGAMKDFSDGGKKAGRQSISGAGFSKKWQNAFRADLYPKGRQALQPAVVFRHKIPYADIFETGGAISGRGLLWLPLSSAPKLAGGRRIRPKDYRSKIGWPLYSVNYGGTPMLGAYVRTTEARFQRSGVSLSLLRRGRNPGGRGEVRFVPLYVGVSRVTIGKKFNIRQALAEEATKIPGYYASRINRSF